jgi:hypothetical protein
VRTAFRIKHLLPTAVCAIAASAALLVLAPGATTAQSPILALGPITIANGVATLEGTLGPQASGAAVSVNGQPLGVDAFGAFAGVVDLKGAAAIRLELTHVPGALAVAFRIPVSGAGVIAGSVLDALTNAGVSITRVVVRGGGVTVSGSVLDLSQLSGLRVNGIDVLRLLGSRMSFILHLPGTTKIVTVVATDTQGVSQSTELAVGSTAVAAQQAVGLRIAKIRYVKKGVLRTRRIRVIVSVKDARGLLVRGATIVVRAKGRRLARKPRTAHTGAKGRATVALRLRPSAFGKRLVTVTAARTPSAKARKTTATLVPKARHARMRR